MLITLTQPYFNNVFDKVKLKSTSNGARYVILHSKIRLDEEKSNLYAGFGSRQWFFGSA
jgi:hypothetical protein